jgi:Porin-like glycoporin RafY
MKLFKLSAIATALIAATAAQAATNVNTNVEIDNVAITDQGLTQYGRIEFNLDSKQGKDNFVSGKGSLIGNRAGGVSIDDMWIQFGNSMANAKLGRFQAQNLFPLTDSPTIIANSDTGIIVAKIAGAATGYQADVLRGRDTSGSSNPFHATVGLNLTPNLTAEIGLLEHKLNTTNQVKGFRPAITATYDNFKLGAGVEAITYNNAANVRTTSTGLGLTAGFKIAGASINANYASIKIVNIQNSSIGLNGTFGSAGVGFVQDKTDGMTSVSTAYAAYTMPLFGIAGASVTPIVSTSKATGFSNVNGLNVRLRYEF